MPDANNPLSDDIDSALPQGEALVRAQQELQDIEPGPRDPLHFGEDGVPTQTGEDPISDFTGRRNGP